MEDTVTIVIAVLVAAVAHVWIFLWVRFKIDEGSITRFLRDSADSAFHHSDTICTHTSVPLKRVRSVCQKSKEISNHPEKSDTWCLAGSTL
jgi:hypothetical protein